MRAIAEGQEGVLSRDQLRAAGLSEARIARWLADARLARHLPRVYTLGHRVLSVKGRLIAALLYAGPAAVLSHTTAAWWWGLLETVPRRIHLSVPVRRRSTSEVKVHRPRDLQRVMHRGLPVTPVPRTVLDIAPDLSHRCLRRAVAEVEFQGLATLDELEAALRRGHPGASAVRRAIAVHRPELAVTRNRFEERFVELCERRRVPMPAFNEELLGFIVDAVWLDDGLVVELDGKDGHATPARMERDRRRDLTLRLAGFDVWRYTWPQLTDSEPAIAAELKARLG